MKIKKRVFLMPGLVMIGVLEGSIVCEVLYFMFKAEAVVGFMVGFPMVVTILIKVPSRSTRLGIGVGSRGLMIPLEVKISYAWAKVIPRSENSWRAFFVKLE